MRLLLPALLLLIGCAAHARAEAEAPPAWATPEGRDSARLDVVRLLLDNGNPEGALTLIAKLREQGFEDPELNLLQGQALARTGLLDDARAQLSAVPRRHPAYGAAQNELGMLEMDARQVDLAIDHLELATQADPKAARYWNNLGFALLTASRAEEAITALRQSVALDGSNPRTRNNLGYALLAIGKDDEAWRMFRSTGTEADARYNQGVGYELRGDVEAAVTAYGRALELAPDHPQARAALARVFPAESRPAEIPSPPPTESP